MADSDLSSITRDNYQKLYKPRLNKGILQRSNFFSLHVVDSWNKLPEEVVSRKTVNSFKNRRTSTRRHRAQEALPNKHISLQ